MHPLRTKKFFYAGLAILLLTLPTLGQTQHLRFFSDPQQNQGFALWNDLDEAGMYQVEIRLRIHSQGSYSETSIESFKLEKQNYYRVPEAYLRSDSPYKEYRLEISPLNENGEASGETASISLLPKSFYLNGDGAGFIKGCSTTCSGNDYAYTIQQYVMVNENGELQPEVFYRLEQAVESTQSEEGITVQYLPYYEYTGDETFYDAYLNEEGEMHSWLLAYRDMPFWSVSNPGVNSIHAGSQNTVPDVIAFEPLQGYEDAFGYPLLSWQWDWLIGMKKGRGSWAGGSYQTPILAQEAATFCSFSSPETMIDLMNQHIFNDLPNVASLSCNGDATFELISNDLNVYTAGCLTSVCFAHKPDGTNQLLSDWVNYVKQMAQASGHPSLDATHPLKNLQHLSIQKWSYQGFESVLNKRVSSLFDENDQYLLGDFLLEKGLYTITSLATNGKLYSSFFELEEGTSLGLSLANQLQISLYPNPLGDEGLNVEISSPQDMVVQHEILNPNGFVIYQNKPRLFAEERFSGTLFLTNIDAYPFLIHRVTCPDGSIHSHVLLLK